MIREIQSGKVMSSYIAKMKGSDNIYAQKIIALHKTYETGNPICHFYTQLNDYAEEAVLIARIGAEFSLARLNIDMPVYVEVDDDDLYAPPKYNEAEYCEANYPELAAFLYMLNARTVFLSAEMMEGLEQHIKGKFLYNCLMEYSGDEVRNLSTATQVISEKNPDKFPLDKIYEILKDDFIIDRQMWLADVSHRVRHGISTVYLYNNVSTATVLFDNENIVYLTQVCTRSDKRGNGFAKQLLTEVCGYYKSQKRKVLLVCRPEKADYYISIGFKHVGRAANIYEITSGG
ncbi:MAG: GNAT family N-acetyltransferase [Oscillospiraceae bacterium]|jgi:ribosomal protein S18 acetylase RimI-like enzyme|nr:GNAT family N-acetyltransferase [Oscillospiraceae bacterium]